MIAIPKRQQDLVMYRVKYARTHPQTMLDWDEVAKTRLANQAKAKSDIKRLHTWQIQRHNKI